MTICDDDLSINLIAAEPLLPGQELLQPLMVEARALFSDTMAVQE